MCWRKGPVRRLANCFFHSSEWRRRVPWSRGFVGLRYAQADSAPRPRDTSHRLHQMSPFELPPVSFCSRPDRTIIDDYGVLPTVRNRVVGWMAIQPFSFFNAWKPSGNFTSHIDNQRNDFNTLRAYGSLHKFPHFGGASSGSPTSIFPVKSGPRLIQPSENGANTSAMLHRP